MSSDPSSSPSKESRAQAFVRGAGEVQDPEHKLWAPARWLVQMIQYLIAIIMITIAEGIKSIVSGEKPKHRRRE
ncbi:hypothetical protein AC578_6273 [Pseudocercospora eumusae]|uniref:Uncharacterized protein n=1 Tax=Pseudocercospora eumusae TaxID=321146 RepID=A0A139H025_9PEZI|nr:hypothetical protein AC578_6273 [Pseudocercospora eumusae]